MAPGVPRAPSGLVRCPVTPGLAGEIGGQHVGRHDVPLCQGEQVQRQPGLPAAQRPRLEPSAPKSPSTRTASDFMAVSNPAPPQAATSVAASRLQPGSGKRLRSKLSEIAPLARSGAIGHQAPMNDAQAVGYLDGRTP
jgi:hypothetical protein